MAARRRRARKNPFRTVGALIVNPRKRRTRRKAKANRRRVRKNPLLVRANRRRRSRKVSARPNRRRRVVARSNRRRRARKNPLLVRANPRRRRSRRHVRANSRRRSHRRVRRNALLVRTNRRRSHRRRPRHNRRRHSLRVRRNSGAVGGIQAMLRKIPLLGGVLSSMVGLVMPAALGALSVEPTMQAARLLGGYVPQMPSTLFYPAVGLLIAAVVKGFGGKFMSAQLVDKLAVAAASAGGAVGYYKWRTGQESDMAGELGLLDYAGFGEGLYSRVIPFR